MILSRIKEIIKYSILVLLILFGISASYDYVYEKGIKEGYRQCNVVVEKERNDWKENIRNIQESHNLEITKLTKDYESQIKTLDKNLEELKENPKVIEKYIEVPIEIPDKIILLHDRSAKGESLYTMIPKDYTTKNKYNINDLAKKINRNYNICLKDQERLRTLQSVVKDFIEKQNDILSKEKK